MRVDRLDQLRPRRTALGRDRISGPIGPGPAAMLGQVREIVEELDEELREPHALTLAVDAHRRQPIVPVA